MVPLTRVDYWESFERFLKTNSIAMELGARSAGYYRTVGIPGIPRSIAHLAVVATVSNSAIRSAGNRTQLVLTKLRADYLWATLLEDRSRIEAEIGGVAWRDQPVRGSSHLEVWKSSNLNDVGRWVEDFAWLAGNVMLFERVLQPTLARALAEG